MATRNRSTLAALVFVLGLASDVVAQGTPTTVKEEKQGMFKLVKVAPADAIKTAQTQFPNAVILSGELEKEDRKLSSTFDLRQPGIEEVDIHANTGTVIKTEHEDPTPPGESAPKQPAAD